MKIAYNPDSGLYYNGTEFAGTRQQAAALPALRDELFKLSFPHRVTVVDLDGPKPQAMPSTPTPAPTTAPAAEPKREVAVLTNPKDGSVFVSSFVNDEDAVKHLAELISKASFVTDFVYSIRDAAYYSINRKRPLSAGRRYWLHKLATKGLHREPRPQSDAPKQEIDLSGLRNIFSKAGETLKRPALVLTLPDSRKQVKVSVAGPSSKFKGQLIVASPEFKAAYYGRVDGSTYVPGRDSNDAVVSLLRRLSENPEKVAAEQGHLTGKCCFCRRCLNDKRSTEVGYGPDCAEKYGLKWGNKPALAIA